jgi:acetyl esterase/lipase
MEATKFLIKNAKLYGLDAENVVLVGDSAGGNLATVVNRKLIEENIIKPKLKVLIYPILQFFDFALPSYKEFMSERILGNIDNENFKNFIHYFTGYKVDDTILENGHSSALDKESEFSRFVDRNLLPDEFKLNKQFYKPISEQLNSTIDLNLKNMILHPDISPLLVSDSVLEATSALHTYVLTVGHDILRDDGLIYVKRLENLNLNVKHVHYKNLFHGIFGLLNGILKFDLSHHLMENVSDHIRHVIAL